MNAFWERLNAYVDGELSPAEAAEVAAAVARDAELAGRVATLTRLKAATSGLAPQHPAPPPPRLPARRSRSYALPLVASLVLLIVAAVSIWLWRPDSQPPDSWLAQAAASHRAWIQSAGAGEAPGKVLAALQAGDIVDVPDLTDAHLSLVHAAAESKTGGVFLGYRGIHGCRVGLWIGAPSPDLGAQPKPVASDDIAGYAWRLGNTGYALLARGMDPSRLKQLADAVAKITGQGNRLNQEIRTALRNTAQTGAPCQA
ncbi:MAG: zf-HC2 domain-containing protein [Pseudomonadota bacterium]